MLPMTLCNSIFFLGCNIAMYMRALSLLWIVAASAAISVGTTAVIMVILRNSLVAQITNASTIVPFSIAGIVIGIIGLVTSHYHPQIKGSKKIKRILTKVKRIGAEVNFDDDIRKDYFLSRITDNISLITNHLVILDNHLWKCIDNSVPESWQTVRYIADRSRKKMVQLEQEVVLDFAQIIDLVQDPSLADRRRANSIYYSLYLCQEIIQMNPGCNEHLLRDLRNVLRTQIVLLDETLVLLEKEREN
jgi:hypothetical protein